MQGFATITLLLLAIAAVQAEEPRLRAPDAAHQKVARAAIQDVFGGEIAKAKTAAARRELAAKMLAVANDPKESPANRWVLYLQARDQALAASDISLMVKALDDLSKAFAVNRGEICIESIEKVKSTPNGSAKALLDLISSAAEDALNADSYSLAVKILGNGVRIANLNQDAAAARRFDARIRTANEQARLFEAAKDSDEANGRFLCFRKNDWAKGLPLLVKTKDEDLAVIARTDLGGPKEAKEQADLGSAWVFYAEKLKGPERIAVMRRAIYWGTQGAHALTGLAKAKAEQRIGKAINEVDEADAKEGLFSFYAGEWTIKYTSGFSRDYSIDATGKISASDGTTGSLTRSKPDVVANLSDGKLERFRLIGNTLQIDHFSAPANYPSNVTTTGVGTPKKR